MKRKPNSMSRLLILPIFALLIIGITSCSKDDNGGDTPGNVKIDAAVGTYKGTIEVFRGTQTQEYFNAIVNVTKVNDKELKVAPKSGEAYSDATPETFFIQSVSDLGLSSTNSRFIYQVADKSLNFITTKDQENEIIFHFTGTKQ